MSPTPTRTRSRRAAAPAEPKAPSFAVAAEIPGRIDVLGVPVYSDLSAPSDSGALLDKSFLEQRRFEGRPGQAQALLADDGVTILALGVGEKGEVTADDLRRAAATLARQAGRAKRVATTLGSVASARGSVTSDSAAAAVVEGFGLASYRYIGGGSAANGKGPIVDRLTLVGAPRAAVDRAAISVECAWAARDWVNTPPRDLTPRELANQATALARRAGVAVQVWDHARIERERLGGLLGVSAGAEEPPRLLRFEYRSADRNAPTVHLVGKGITFDSGGLSLKPPGSMMTMKCDMGGAAAVIGATLGAARLKLGINIVCWVAATENMPSGAAIHPGDVLTIRNGKTVEVLNTDAEGRLVLADALSLAVEEGPDAILDLATLTGAASVALGDKVAAVMGTDEKLVAKVIDAGKSAGEPHWELPLVAAYRKRLDSDVADVKNVTTSGGGGTITAGLFLREFVGSVPWAHLDIASPAWADGEDAWITKGGTGWGVRTLIELLANW